MGADVLRGPNLSNISNVGLSSLDWTLFVSICSYFYFQNAGA